MELTLFGFNFDSLFINCRPGFGPVGPDLSGLVWSGPDRKSSYVTPTLSELLVNNLINKRHGS